MPEQPIGQKEQTLTALTRSKFQIEKLLATFEAIEEKLDPEPAPKPDTIDPNIFFSNLLLKPEINKLEKVAYEFECAVTDFRNAIKSAQQKLCNGRNRKAWHHILERADAMNFAQYDSVMRQIKLYEQQALFIARLVTYANADCLPYEVEQ